MSRYLLLLSVHGLITVVNVCQLSIDGVAVVKVVASIFFHGNLIRNNSCWLPGCLDHLLIAVHAEIALAIIQTILLEFLLMNALRLTLVLCVPQHEPLPNILPKLIPEAVSLLPKLTL